MPRGSKRGTFYYPRPATEEVERFDLDQVTFTAGMAKRPGAAGVFDAAPIIQSSVDVATHGDLLSFLRGDALGNAVSPFYANIDQYQYTVVLWVTPEWAGTDGGNHYLYRDIPNAISIYKTAASNLVLFAHGQYVALSAAAWVAGSSYLVIGRSDAKCTLDGTNYLCLSVNDAHTFGGTATPTVATPGATQYVGASGATQANAIIEGLTVYRRVLYDGAYGVPPVDGSDELAAIYAAGAGLDPAQVAGSFDCTFCLPTDCTVGALVTGTGEAWSQPHASSLPDVSFVSDGDPPGTPFAVEFDGSSTYVDCGSDPSIDNIPNGAQISIGIWVRMDADPSADECILLQKGNLGADGYTLAYDKVNDRFRFQVELAAAEAEAFSETYIPDGKFHFIAAHYVDATQTATVAFDGRWGAGVAGAGAYQLDAARNLFVGRFVTAGTWYLHGGSAWWEIWNNDHYGAGTDFIPPRAPTAAGPANLVETWWADEGTGVTVAARVTSPNNDGTITSGSWSAVWEQEGTPVIPQSLEFDGAVTVISRGGAAAINDLPDNAVAGKGPITVEGWYRLDAPPPGNAILVQKGFGWVMYMSADGVLLAVIFCATSTSTATYALGCDDVHHHLAFTYDETGDRKVYLWVDGILRAIGGASAGNYTSDAAAGLFKRGIGAGSWLGGVDGWFRVSNNVRYIGATIGQAYFRPNARSNSPAIDGNTMLQWDMTDGAGLVVTDTSGGGLNGAITMGDGRWFNTCDMETESPGERVYPWGYSLGSDGANDGLTIIEDAEVTAGVSYVARASLSIGMSGRAKPYVYLWDNIGGAQIGASFPFPFMTGVHDGGAAAATLQDSTARWVYNYVGWTVYNITDGSSATITANTQITQIGALAGGGSNDWQIGETYLLRPPSNRSYSQHPWQETFVFTAPAGCTSADFKALNSAGKGVTHVQQCSVLLSLLAHGDMEAGAGNPWIPTGWANVDLDAGDSAAGATVHAGVQSMQFNVGASAESMRQQITAAIGSYVLLSMWSYGDGSAGFTIGGLDATQMVLHSDATVFNIATPHTAQWSLTQGLFRVVATNPFVYITADAGAAGARSVDDVSAILVDDVSLTVTPAIYANSLESGGIRVDGIDDCTHPVGRLAEEGALAFRVIVRQGVGIVGDFHDTYAYLCDLRLDANNYLFLRLDNANQLELEFNALGAGAVNVTWNAAAEWALGDDKLIELAYGRFGVRVFVDNRQRLTSYAPCIFASPPTVWQIGADTGVVLQGDIVVREP